MSEILCEGIHDLSGKEKKTNELWNTEAFLKRKEATEYGNSRIFQVSDLQHLYFGEH